jgi:WD40 repeat protein
MATPLSLAACIGFGGNVHNGLVLHNDGRTIIYPLGSTIVLRDKHDPKAQEFLQGHTDKVTCMALSPSGRFLASGQMTYMGFTADIIVWDLQSRCLVHRLQLQKVPVQLLSWFLTSICATTWHGHHMSRHRDERRPVQAIYQLNFAEVFTSEQNRRKYCTGLMQEAALQGG